MSTYHTDEEQLANLKRMWNEYGKTTVIIVIIVAALTAGWFFYKEKQHKFVQAGAVEYHKLLEMMEQSDGSTESAEKLEAQAQLLKNQYSKTPYAAAGSLLIAKNSVDRGNIPEAKAQLEWVVLNSTEYDLTELAHARLARVLLSEKNYEAALKELDNQKDKRYESEFQEIRGDIYYSMQKTAEARAAYEAALKSMPNTPEKMLVQMKYDDLATPNDVLWAPVGEDEQKQEKKQ